MIRRIKWENIFLILISPLPVIQFIDAGEGYKLASIVLSLIFYGGFYIIIKMMRKEEI